MAVRYPATSLWTMAQILLKELGLEGTPKDIRDFGYLPGEGIAGAMYVEVFEHDSEGKRIGTIRHTRWIEHNAKYDEWENPLDK